MLWNGGVVSTKLIFLLLMSIFYVTCLIFIIFYDWYCYCVTATVKSKKSKNVVCQKWAGLYRVPNQSYLL